MEILATQVLSFIRHELRRLGDPDAFYRADNSNEHMSEGLPPPFPRDPFGTMYRGSFPLGHEPWGWLDVESGAEYFVYESTIFKKSRLKKLVSGDFGVAYDEWVSVPDDLFARLPAAIAKWFSESSWYGAEVGRAFPSLFSGNLVDSSLPANDPRAAHVSQLEESVLWVPGNAGRAVLCLPAPALKLAEDLLARNRDLAEMSPRKYEELIAELLERAGWQAHPTRISKDGGIDVIATKMDPLVGYLAVAWQAKCYRSTNKVKQTQVRELVGSIESKGFTKAVIATTSTLTTGAVAYVEQHKHRLSAVDGAAMREWIVRAIQQE